MRVLLALCLSLVVLTASGNAEELQAIAAKTDGTHAAVAWPPSREDLRDAMHVWVWSREFPPVRFETEVIAAGSEAIVAELQGAPRRSLEVRVRGWEQPESLASLHVIVAPGAMWGSVPEPLLPRFALPKEGVIMVPLRESVRIRAVGADSRSTWASAWQDVPAASRAVDVMLRKPAVNARMEFERSDGGDPGRVFVLAMSGSARPRSVWAQYVADEDGIVEIPSLPESQPLTLFVTSDRAAPRTISGLAVDLRRRVVLDPPATIGGRFVDEEQQPLSGVIVLAEVWASPDAPAASRSEAKSDAAGRWKIAGLPAGRAVIRAAAKGRVTLQQRVQLETGAAVDLGTLALSPSHDLALLVTDEEKQPLAGVEVTTDSGFAGKTNEKGVVSVTGLASDMSATLTASAPRFASQKLRLSPPLPQKETVVLERAFTVMGRVVDEEGEPHDDAMIVVSIANRTRRELVESGGAFSFDLDAGEDFSLTIESPRTASIHRSEKAGRAGEVRDLGTLRLPFGLSIRGRVVDASGQPAAGARIWTLRPSASALAAWYAGRIIQTNSDSDGSFEITGMSSGPSVVRIDAPDHARAHRAVTFESDSLELEPIYLLRGSTVTLREVPEAASVVRLDLRGEGLDADMLVSPVLDRVAHVRHVPAGTYRLTAAGARAVLCERVVTVTEGDDLEVVCPPPMLVRGRVVIGEAPAFGGSLVWNRPSAGDALVSNRYSPMGALQQNVHGMEGGTVVVPVRPDGTFETKELRSGDWRVSWRSTEHGVTPDQSYVIVDAPEVEVVVEFRGGVVRGRVVDSEERPVAGARVREIQGPLFAMSRADGSFMLAGVSPGVHRLQARLDQKASEVVTVQVEAEQATPDLALRIDELERNALIVEVLGTDGIPQPNAFVFVEGGGGMARILTADGRGIARATFPEGLPEGARLAAYAGGSWAFDRLRRVGGDADPQQGTLRMTPPALLTVRSRSLSGSVRIVSSQSGDLTWMLERVGTPLTVGPESVLVVPGLPGGTYEVSLANQAVTVSLTSGSTATATLP